MRFRSLDVLGLLLSPPPRETKASDHEPTPVPWRVLASEGSLQVSKKPLDAASQAVDGRGRLAVQDKRVNALQIIRNIVSGCHPGIQDLQLILQLGFAGKLATSLFMHHSHDMPQNLPVQPAMVRVKWGHMCPINSSDEAMDPMIQTLSDVQVPPKNLTKAEKNKHGA